MSAIRKTAKTAAGKARKPRSAKTPASARTAAASKTSAKEPAAKLKTARIGKTKVAATKKTKGSSAAKTPGKAKRAVRAAPKSARKSVTAPKSKAGSRKASPTAAARSKAPRKATSRTAAHKTIAAAGKVMTRKSVAKSKPPVAILRERTAKTLKKKAPATTPAQKKVVPKQAVTRPAPASRTRTRKAKAVRQSQLELPILSPPVPPAIETPAPVLAPPTVPEIVDASPVATAPEAAAPAPRRAKRESKRVKTALLETATPVAVSPVFAEPAPPIALPPLPPVPEATKVKPAAEAPSQDKSATERPSAAAADKPEKNTSAKQAGSDSRGFGGEQMPMPDFQVLSQNMARLVEEGGKAVAAYLKPIEQGRTNPDMAEHVEDAVKTLGHVAEHWLSDPARTVEAQSAIAGNLLELWSSTLRRFSGEDTLPVRALDPTDKRFSDPEWSRNPIYDFLRQAYVITTEWANDLVKRADTIDPATREKAQFYLRQIAGAISPSNFIATNPELLRTTLAQNGENLVRGMHMLAEDIEAGHGSLKIRQSDASKLLLGRDMAATPGKVVFRNDLMELIQYSPSTDTVLQRPLLIVPPWINKFYVLDLNPEKSFVRWCVAQGLTVFVISWVNPDERHASKSFEDYMKEGILTALEEIEIATGERQVSTIGYCVGGTLLAITLAYMAAKGDDRITSSTFLTTQVDFTDAGELKLFVDKIRIKSIEEKMAETGYLEGSKMATAFNMLRPNELIWSYVVNNYLKGKEPMPFDLLSWNSDSTRMPAANHSFYLRNCYLENNLTGGRLSLGGVKLDLHKVKVPVYHLATREDHIAPARSVYTGAGYFGGPVRYVLAGSGHIAGVVNPASKPKYQFWAGPPVAGPFESWLQQATETPGSWWGDWIGWLTAQAPERVPARQPGGGKLEPLCDAPGDYVRVKA